MKIGVIGGGTVGRAAARAYLEHVEEVRVWDVVPERGTSILPEVLACDLVFVCVPEHAVEPLVARFPPESHDVRLVLKSTVPIGTTSFLGEKYGLSNLVHSPEFLTERCAVTDAQLPARNLIGIQKSGSGVGAGALALRRLYETRFPHVPIHVGYSEETEAVKLFQNAFFAVKVSFWNEMKGIADRLGLDWDRVLNGILADGRIHPSHTQVPGPDGKRGFGGKCLPKDLVALINQGRIAGAAMGVCIAAEGRNRMIDREGDI